MQNFITINIRIYIINLILQYKILKKANDRFGAQNSKMKSAIQKI